MLFGWFKINVLKKIFFCVLFILESDLKKSVILLWELIVLFCFVLVLFLLLKLFTLYKGFQETAKS